MTIINLIKTYPVSFFLFIGLAISVAFTVYDELKRRKNKKNKNL